MSTGLLDIMKRASMDAMDNAQMCDLRYGKVVSTKPLKVQVTNLFIIPESLLIVPQHLTDYELKVTTSGYGWNTDNESGGAEMEAFDEHGHKINQSEKTIKVHNALKNGDKVALLRKQGGQSYFILDRLPKE